MSHHVLRRHLSMPGMLSSVHKTFATIPDMVRYREYSLPDCLIVGLELFTLKYPSLLQFYKQTHSEEADPVMATTLLDRLQHHSIVISITGSYRLRDHKELVLDHIRARKSLLPLPPPRKRVRKKKPKGGEVF